MIVGSLLLILAAVTLLVIGLAQGSSPLLISSIVASLLAAVALVVGARQAAVRSGRVARVREAAGGAEPDAFAPGGAEPDAFALGASAGESARPAEQVSPAAHRADPGDEPGAADADHGSEPAYGSEPAFADDPVPVGTAARRGSAAPHQRAAAGPGDAAPDPARDVDLVEPDPEDPADEPRAQRVAPADAAQLAVTTIEVLVVDGRPRYHVTGCPHLTGRETEAVPVAEAIDLGFTPCGICRPVDRLTAAARPH
jgi:hypothetical protein